MAPTQGTQHIEHPLVIAHRGASGSHLENSRAAFRAAVDMGADGIELDVHATNDGELVVHHDAEIGGSPIASRDWAELSHASLANGESIPLLGEVLEMVASLLVYVEVKDLAPEWDQRLLDVLDGGPSPERYAGHSFDHRIIARLGRLRPDLARGILLCSRPVDPGSLLAATGATTLWQERQWLDKELVTQVHAIGATVIAWTVDDENEMRHLQQIDVDGVCGNHPDRLRTVLGDPRG